MKKINIKLFGMDITWADMKQVYLVFIFILSLMTLVIGFFTIPVGIFFPPSFETVGWGLLGVLFGGLFFVHYGEKLCEPWRGGKP